MQYTEWLPDSDAAEYISEFWRFDAGPLDGVGHEHFIPPDGLPSLWALFRTPDDPPLVGVTGPGRRAHCVRLEPNMTLIGARLRPAVSRAVLGATGEAIADRMGPAAILGLRAPNDFAQAATRALRHGATHELNGAVVSAGINPDLIDLPVMKAASTLIARNGDASLAALAEESGLSTRQFRRRFTQEIGLSPKGFAQVRRIRRLCHDALVASLGWKTLSLEAGFADQAHMARSIQSVFGLPPARVREAIARIAHGDIYS